MIIGGKNWPKDRLWIVGIIVATVLVAAAYGVEWWATGRLPGGSSRTGFMFGIVAGLIILFELLLWPRKRVRSWRVGSAQAWLRAHVWLGLLAVPLVLMHARLWFIGGLLNQALMVTFMLVIVSGVWGLVMQQYLPKAMLDRVPAETIHDQIDHVAAQECADAEKLVRATCEPTEAGVEGEDHAVEEHSTDEYAVVTGFRAMTGIQGKVLETFPLYRRIPGTREITASFFGEIRPYLLQGGAARSRLADVAESLRFFMSLREASPGEARSVIDQLEMACDHRRQFDLQSRLHRWLHGWLLVHVPLSVVLGVLLAIHVPVAIWYW